MSREQPRTLLEQLAAAEQHTWPELTQRFLGHARDLHRETGEPVASLSWEHLQRIAAGKVTRPHPSTARVLQRQFGRSIDALLGPPERQCDTWRHASIADRADPTIRPDPQNTFESAVSVPVDLNQANPPPDIDDFAKEILNSDTSDEAISRLAHATVTLAELHTQVPAQRVLAEVLGLYKQTFALVRGRQRLSQRRELFRVESDLLAHACLLFGDIKQNVMAERYGCAALSFADEAGASTAIARSALAKTFRWAERLVESANMARLGYENSPAKPIRLQLASQEANAAALLGDEQRAREALQRADQAANSVSTDSEISAWSFPTGRQAIFLLSVATQTGDPDAALRAAAMADDCWAAGESRVATNWAQIRIGAGIAHLLKGSLEAAIQQVIPVLDLAPELRIATVTGYIDSLDIRLREPRLHGNRAARELRQQMESFSSSALPAIAE